MSDICLSLCRLRGQSKWKSEQNTTTTSARLTLTYTGYYYLSVEASYNQTQSPMTGKIPFRPYSQTTIGPPELSLACCGNCIQMNMSLVEPDKSAGISDIHKIYNLKFRIQWRTEETEENYRETRNKNFTLDNLQTGVKYCVQVHPMISVNPNTQWSSWKCIFTDPVERRDPVVVGVVIAALIVALGVLMTSIFFLYYTGFLCKVARLPRAVIMALSQGYTLTPEGTSSDPVSITSEKDKLRNNNNLMSLPVIGDRDEDKDEEEEEGVNYMDRNVQFSSGESLCCDSANMQVTSKPGAPGDCGSFTDRLSSEVEVPDAPYEGGLSHGTLDEGETNMKISTVPEGGQTEFKEPFKGEEMEEVFDSSCAVNLFSVTLAALGGGEKEEEEEEEEHNTRNSLIDLSRLCDVEPRLVTVLSVMSELPQPVNLTLTSIHLRHMLKWQPGPETPPGVHYNVTVNTDRGTSWVSVSGCERVRHPLVCNLTDAFPELTQVYLVQVTAWLEGQASHPLTHLGFTPIKDTCLEQPLLTVTPCGRDLCVDLQPPKEHLRQAYDTLDYKLKFVTIRSLKEQTVKDLAPGREYCVSVCSLNILESKESNYSEPKCAFTTSISHADPWISAMLCLLVLIGVAVFSLLVFTGFFCLREGPLPLVLTSVHHADEVLVISPYRTPLSSLFNVKATLPSAGERKSSRSSLEESDGEGGTESTGDSRPETQPSAGLNHTLGTHTDTHSVTTETVQTSKEEGEGVDSQDVNLLTLTFGSHEKEEEEEEEEKEEEHVGVAEPGLPSVSEEVNITIAQPSQTWNDTDFAMETTSADEEGEEESGYMGRPLVGVFLPAPSMVSISSFNLEHTLSFLPGPGTPPDAHFTVQIIRQRKSSWRPVWGCLKLVVGQMCNLTTAFKNLNSRYQAQVQAFTTNQTSNWTVSKWFQPLSDTVLGPPDVSVSGCGNCLNLQLRLPVKTLGQQKLQLKSLYRGVVLHVHRTRDGLQFRLNLPYREENVITYLQPGVEYCVTVTVDTLFNSNTVSSGPYCAFTSPPPPMSSVYVVVGLLGASSMLGLLLIGLLVHGGQLSLSRTLLRNKDSTNWLLKVYSRTPAP
ncbi:hypothetical protein INR49_030016 [Caranx melampygus]|nr:hypothetical protein INR49_030016 [Caranx melampygus]